MKSGAEQTVETGALTIVKCGGELSTAIVPNTAMPAMVGTIENDELAVFIFGVKINPTTWANEYIMKKSENFDHLAHMKSSDIPLLDADYAPLGYVLVINETGVDFVGGTTPLNTSWVTAVFVNNFGFIGY